LRRLRKMRLVASSGCERIGDQRAVPWMDETCSE
jgi:hypothetical protein